MLIPNHIYLVNGDKKLKLFVNELLSESDNLQFKVSDLIISIDNTDDCITVKLLRNNELQGIITYDKDE